MSSSSTLREMTPAVGRVFICWLTVHHRVKHLFYDLLWHHAPSPVLSLMPLIEPVPLPDRGEEQWGSEDPTGERGRGVEGLLWRRISGDSGWVRHEIRSGVHLSGYDVSTALIYGLYLTDLSLSHSAEWRREGEQKEKRSSKDVSSAESELRGLSSS